LQTLQAAERELEGAKFLAEDHTFYSPLVKESEQLKPTLQSALDYVYQQQKQITAVRSQAINSLFALLGEEPPLNPYQLTNPTFKRFVDSLNNLDSVTKLEAFQTQMTQAINEQKQANYQVQMIQTPKVWK